MTRSARLAKKIRHARTLQGHAFQPVQADQKTALLRHFHTEAGEPLAILVPPGNDTQALQHPLAGFHYCTNPDFSGAMLGRNAYGEIEAAFFKNSPALVVIDNFLMPAPVNWTFEDYNGESGKMAAFIAENNATPRRVAYRENRCVLFDSTLFHTTDEIHFKPGYCNRRINVTLLFGKSLNTD